MKKKIVLLVILVIGFAAGNALANALLNPGFEEGALGRFTLQGNVTYWTTGPGTQGYHHNDVNYGGVNCVHSGAKAVKIWMDDTGIYQDFSVDAGNRYDFSVWALAASTDNLGLRFADAVFQVEWYDDGNDLILAEEIGRFYGAKIVGEPCDPYNTWKFISGTRTAPSLAVTCKVLLYLDRHEGAADIDGSINWDDVSVTYSYGASEPKPADDPPRLVPLVPFEVTALSWTRPAPRHGGDTIRCDVWFGTDGNMPGTNTKILNKQDANSVAISSLASHQDYYWRVDCYDPNTPGPEIKSEGLTWTFNTADNCVSYMPGDIHEDCYVNFADVEEMAANWLKCNDVSNPQCQ
jgi:hypothetical protein